MQAKDKKFAVIVSRWNEAITNALLEGALDEFLRHGDPDVEVIHVPGTWEIPIVAGKLLGRTGKSRPNGIVALGCILQGATSHAQLLAGDVGSALMTLQVNSGVPISWGILTPDNAEQAMERAGLKMGNKGREAALAAIEMADVMTQL